MRRLERGGCCGRREREDGLGIGEEEIWEEGIWEEGIWEEGIWEEGDLALSDI